MKRLNETAMVTYAVLTGKAYPRATKIHCKLACLHCGLEWMLIICIQLTRTRLGQIGQIHYKRHKSKVSCILNCKYVQFLHE